VIRCGCCPIVAYSGSADPGAAPGELSAWGELTSGGVAWRRFNGDHFYLRVREAELVADIVSRMSNCAAATVVRK
jgi:pyochelin biosynthetic protein PchC